MPDGLRKALFCFLVGATAKTIVNPRGADGYAFLCHVSVARLDHHFIARLIDSFLQDLHTLLQNQVNHQENTPRFVAKLRKNIRIFACHGREFHHLR